MEEAYYPVNDRDDIDLITDGVLMTLASHWRTYNRTPPGDRLGDEDTWDMILPKTLTDVGIKESRARELCEMAKLDAQLE